MDPQRKSSGRGHCQEPSAKAPSGPAADPSKGGRTRRDLGGTMLRSTRVLKFAAAVVAAVTLLGATTTRSRAQTTGRVSLHIVKAGFIVGVGGGDGVLLYHGRRYHLAVGGVGV